MIELYTWGTTNGRRPVIMLEEIGLPYKLIPVDIKSGAQRSPEHLARSPAGKIPALVDTDGPGGKPATLFESVSMLLYLGDKTGKLMGATPADRPNVLKWTMFSAATLLPTFGMMRTYKDLEPCGSGATRRARRPARPDAVPSWRLFDRRHCAGHAAAAVRRPRVAEERPNVARWLGAVLARPAVKKGLEMKIG